MAEISLICGGTVLVDDQDVERLQAHRWSVDTWGAVYTRVPNEPGRGKRAVLMTRMMLGLPQDQSVLVLCKDGNKFDLRRENLQVKQRSWQKLLPDIACACGCGRKIRPYKSCGLPNHYVLGHARRHATEEEKLQSRSVSRGATYQKHRKLYRCRKRLCMEFLGGICYFCGLAYDGANASSFEFDHVDPNTKTYELSKSLHRDNTGTIADELQKCRLVCANCHNVRHKGEW